MIHTRHNTVCLKGFDSKNVVVFAWYKLVSDYIEGLYTSSETVTVRVLWSMGRGGLTQPSYATSHGGGQGSAGKHHR